MRPSPVDQLGLETSINLAGAVRRPGGDLSVDLVFGRYVASDKPEKLRNCIRQGLGELAELRLLGTLARLVAHPRVPLASGWHDAPSLHNAVPLARGGHNSLQLEQW